MEELDIGSVIRNLRLEKGFSQERLAGGICATSTLSQIENGNREPTRSIINSLMERLGEPGFLYGDFYTARSLQQKKLSQQIVIDIQRRDVNAAARRLEKLAECILEYETAARQMYIFMELMCQLMQGQIRVESECFAAQCEKTLGMREETYEKLAGKMPLDRAEELLLNAFALSRGFMGEYDFAGETFHSLFACSSRNEADLTARNRMLMVILNNYATVLMKQGRLGKALEHVNRAIALSYDSGGLRLTMQLMQTRMAIRFDAGDYAGYHDDYRRIQGMCHFLPPKESPEDFAGWRGEPFGILIF